MTRPLDSEPGGPIASIIIPAHNEEKVITRCLSSLLDDARPGEFEVVVVLNGCDDSTAARARGFTPEVAVLETPVAGKTAALNLGDSQVKAFPRFFIDADVIMGTADLRAVARVLTEDAPLAPAPLAAAPSMRVDTEGCSWLVRQYYRIWLRTLWSTRSMIGSGVYALSEKGRDRFGAIADFHADDYWVSRQFTSAERRSVSEATFTFRGSRNLRLLVRRKARILAYNALVDRALPPESGARERMTGLLGVVRSEPRLAPAALIYLMVAVMTHTLARWRLRRHSLEWTKDR